MHFSGRKGPSIRGALFRDGAGKEETWRHPKPQMRLRLPTK